MSTGVYRKEGQQTMAVLTKPINHAFSVRSDKTEEFLKMKADPEVLRKHQERAKQFEKNRQKPYDVR